MKMYYHKTDGGAEYLFDTFIECANGHKEGAITDETQFIVRLDGPPELTVTSQNKLYLACKAVVANWEGGDLAWAARLCAEAVAKAEKQP